MNESLELHDSELAEIEWRGDALVLTFAPAYVHRSPTLPGESATGWLETAIVVLLRATLHSTLPALPWALSDGSFHHGAGVYMNLIPVPTNLAGPITVDLQGSDSSTLTITAETLSIALFGTGRFLEFTPF
jgi:hypothetical protein